MFSVCGCGAAGEQDFPSLVRQHLSELELGTAPDKLNTVHQMVQAWITDFDSHDSTHAQGTKVSFAGMEMFPI